MQVNTEGVTFNEAFERFINFCSARNLSAESILYYKDCYKYFVKYFDGNNLCRAFKEQDFYTYINFLKETHPNVTDTTINTYLRGLRAIIYYAMKLGYMDKFSVRLMKTDKKIKETYTDEELVLLLKKPDIKKCSFSEYRNWVLINYFLATGNRISTVINIKIGNIDFDSGMIKLDKTKNRKQQIIPLNNTISDILKEYLMYRGGESDEYLFPTQDGMQMQRQGMSTAIERYNRSRGVSKKSVHLFRHTFAKKWILNGGDIFTLKELLGHSSLDMVKEYVNMYSIDLKEQYNKYNPLESLYAQNNLGSKKKIKMRNY